MSDDDDPPPNRYARTSTRQLIEEIHAMTQDFAAAQAGLDAAIGKVGNDVAALLAKVNALPPDQQAEVAAEVTALTASTATLAAIDTSASPPPAPAA